MKKSLVSVLSILTLFVVLKTAMPNADITMTKKNILCFQRIYKYYNNWKTNLEPSNKFYNL